MKIEYILLNFTTLALHLIHSFVAKYDILHYMISTYFALFLMIVLPIILSVINYRASKRAVHLVILNLIFTLCQVAGLCVYDIILFGRVAESYGLLATPTVIYSVIVTCIAIAVKSFRKKYPNGYKFSIFSGEKGKTVIDKIATCMLIVGAAAFVIGFFSLFLGAGLPYPDPTPEMTRKWLFYLKLGKTFAFSGIFLIISGIIMKLFCRNKGNGNNKWKRMLAFFIDTMIAGCIFSSFVLPVLFEYYHLLLIAFVLIYLLKDIMKGQSIGKRIAKIKVVNQSGDTPKFSSLIIRNITLVIWPVEAILVLFGKPRLGDRLAKTMVVDI